MSAENTPATPQGAVAQAALEAVELGLSVIPVGTDKRPLVAWAQFQRRAPRREEAQEWFSRWPEAQLGLVTGAVNGVDVIDFDQLSAPWPPEGRELPADVVVRTPRGGLHYYIKAIPGARNTASALAPGVDTRAEGGYVLIPPSHTDKGSYAYVSGSLADIARLRDWTGAAPDWLAEALAGPAEGDTPDDAGEEEVPLRPRPRAANAPDRLVEGQRNEGLFRMACRLRRAGLDQAELLAAVHAANRRRCQPPLPPEEVDALCRSAARYPAHEVPSAAAAKDYPLTDAGNAELTAALVGSIVRFDHSEGRWYIYAGGHWRADGKSRITRAPLRTAQARLEAALADPGLDDGAVEAVRKWVRASCMAGKVRACLELMEGLPALATVAGDWDSSPRRVAALNGIVDLADGSLSPPRPELLIRSRLNAAWDPAAPAPRWRGFIRDITRGDEQLALFLQRAVGYTLLGQPSEQVFFFLHGLGANGKSVFLTTLRHVFGDYGCALTASCLEATQSSTVPNELASLAGKRLVVGTEASELGTFDAAKLKALTGGEPVKARFLYREWFEFSPQFVLWLAGNKRPRVNDRSEGFWRRVLCVPFERFFAPEERDPTLVATLAAEADGILAWAWAGAQDFRERGLAPPDGVLAANEEYREDNDPLAPFLAACCVLGPGHAASSAELFAAYTAWAAAENVPERRRYSSRALGRHLAARFLRSRDRTGARYAGVALRAAADQLLPGINSPAAATACAGGGACDIM